MMGPLLTLKVHEALRAAARAGAATVECSLDLERSTTTVEAAGAAWTWHGRRFPYLDACRDRTVYHWTGEAFEPAARFTTSLIKLVPTEWGPPTFEIDGVKMLPTARASPYADAERKVGQIEPRGKVILDTCGGLGYFAAWCLRGKARQVLSYEKNPDVIWLRGLNPWSPAGGNGLTLDPGGHRRRDRRSGRWVRRCDPARSAAFRPRRGTLFAGLLRPPRQGAEAQGDAVSLHRRAEQGEQGARHGR